MDCIFWLFKKSKNAEYNKSGENSKTKTFEFMGLFNEYAKMLKRHANDMNENCSKIPKINNAGVFSKNKFFASISEIFIIKKKKDVKSSLVPVNKCLFDSSNMKNTLSRSIIETM
jgi:hypothetical protein